MAVRVLSSGDPSVVRRTEGLLAYATVLYGAAGALLGLAVGLAAALGRDRGGAARRARGTGALVLGLAGALLLSLLGPRFSAARLPLRAAAALGILAAALLLGVLAARFVRARRAPRLGLRTALVLAALVLLGAWGRALAAARGLDRPHAPAAPAAADAATHRPNIVLVVVDTLRADALSCYGGPAGLTPNVQRLAERGVVFDRAISGASWTIPSVASILTSSYPREHGVLDFSNGLRPDAELLPQVLRAAGYHTRAEMGNVFLGRSRGFARGFDFFDQFDFQPQADLLLSGTLEELLRLGGPLRQVPRSAHPILWPDARFPFVTTRLSPNVHDADLDDWLFDFEPPPGDRPLFLYVQYVAPHSPYLEHPYRFLKSWPPFLKADLERLHELYLGEVAYADQAFGELLDRLDGAGVLDDSIVVFTADHGEEFQEHGGWEHGHSVYQEVVHVPLVVAGPGIAPGVRVQRTVSLVDLGATLAELAGAPRAEAFEGRSLAPLLCGAPGGDEAVAEKGVFSEVASKTLNPGHSDFALLEGRWKLVLRRPDEGEEQLLVFDLSADPGEQHPLDPVPAEAAPLVAKLREYAARRAKSSAASVDEDQLAKMRALGYAGGSKKAKDEEP